MTVFLTILFSVLMFGFLITIHEFGHYLFARIFKVGIHEFSIGMGPKILARTSKKTGIQYSLRLLPIGGYVSIKTCLLRTIWTMRKGFCTRSPMAFTAMP